MAQDEIAIALEPEGAKAGLRWLGAILGFVRLKPLGAFGAFLSIALLVLAIGAP